MASLVLGAAGAYFFGPVGWMVGSYLGTLLDPQKQEGPKLGDLRLQGSSYGAMIPIVYGTDRLSGQVIWQTDLIEHKHTSGGKGGPEVTTYSYSASFAVKLCKGPMGGVLRLWADSTLIYDTTTGATTDNTLVPMTVYLGLETDNPDPTIEAAEGVGNVPAFRDDMVLVFTDMDLSAYGNRLPTLSAEVFSVGGPIPYRVSTFTPYGGPTSVLWDSGRILLAELVGNLVAAPVDWTIKAFDLDGTFIEDVLVTTCMCPPGDTGSTWSPVLVTNNPHIMWCTGGWDHTGTVIQQGWFYDGTLVAAPIRDPYGVKANRCIVEPVTAWSSIAQAVYAVGGAPAYVARWPAPGGVPTWAPDVFAFLPPFAATEVGWFTAVADSGEIWCGRNNIGFDVTTHCLVLFDADLNVIHGWESSVLPANMKDCLGLEFTVWQDIFFGYKEASLWLYAWKLNRGSWTWTLTNPGFVTPAAGGNLVSLGNGLAVGGDGLFSLQPRSAGAILGDIVRDVSERAGLTTGQVDVTDLPDTVPGYMITRQSDARSAITPLQQVWFFDGVERDGQMVFVKRGGPSLVTIPDDDLAAHVQGESSPPLVTYKRMQESDLPAIVNVNYMDVDAAYQVGTQEARRQVGQSEAVATLQLPVAIDAATARRAANVNCFGAWLERDGFTLSLPRKYKYLEPTDVITARGYRMRILSKSDLANGLVQLQCVQTNSELYLAAPAGNATSGAQQTQPTPLGPTELLLLDIPLITDAATQNVYEAAMAGADSSQWRGASLQRSIDGGTSYAELINSRDPNIIGTTDDVLGIFLGGNVVDEVNAVNVTIGHGGGDLSSSTYTGILNGANEFLLGAEIINVRDAVLTTGSSYRLTGLLRGRHGTEWAMDTHVAGERFVVLPANELTYQTTDVGITRQYKAITNGSTLASPVQDVELRGVSMTPYSPVHLGAGTNAAGDWTLQWIRRARVNGAWLNFTDVPLDEPTEQYRVTLWSDALYTTIVTTIDCSAPTLTLTAAEQTVLFGSPQSQLFWAVAQIGRFGPGYDSGGHAPTLVTPPPPTPPPATGVPPIGVQWHEDFVFTGGKHADLNANYLMATYGSSWCWTYKVNSAAAAYLDAEVVAGLGGTERSRINFTFLPWSGGNYAPAGTLIPWGTNIFTGPVLHADVPLVDIPLPYPDDAL